MPQLERRATVAPPSEATEFIDELLHRRSLNTASRMVDIPAAPAPRSTSAPIPASTSPVGNAEPAPAHLILLIEDEAHIRHAVRTALGDLPARLDEAATGAEGIAATLSDRPDVVVLDLGLPDIDGLEVCQRIRAHSAVPIIVLSARHSEEEKVALLNAGVDDYITKPFSVLEFAARVQTQIRRAKHLAAVEQEIAPFTIAGLTIDTAERTAKRNGVRVHLTPIEWSILATLVGASGKTLTHQQIFDAVWGRQFGNPQQYLRVHITNLRRKIEARPAEPEIVITEPGIGYRADLP